MEQTISNKAKWTGRILIGFYSLFLAFDAIIHILKIKPVVDSFAQLGIPLSTAVPLGVLVIIMLILLWIRKTSILAGVLFTGYLGGAVATNMNAQTSLFGNILFPVYAGVIMWLGLYLLEPRLRALLPFRK